MNAFSTGSTNNGIELNENDHLPLSFPVLQKYPPCPQISISFLNNPLPLFYTFSDVVAVSVIVESIMRGPTISAK